MNIIIMFVVGVIVLLWLEGFFEIIFYYDYIMFGIYNVFVNIFNYVDFEYFLLILDVDELIYDFDFMFFFVYVVIRMNF